MQIRMGTIELKSKLHKCIDNLSNEELLQALYDFLQAQSYSEGGKEELKEELYALSLDSGNEVRQMKKAFGRNITSKQNNKLYH